jgi:hypothetical protein
MNQGIGKYLVSNQGVGGSEDLRHNVILRVRFCDIELVGYITATILAGLPLMTTYGHI